RTVFGRSVFAIGDNPKAARYAGIKIGLTTTAVYAIAGLTCGIAALLNASRLNSVSSSSLGLFYELDAIAAVVIGGTRLQGGADHGWTAGVGWWAKRAMTLYPDVEFVYSTAAGPEKQIADVEDMMVKGIDGLVILATESAPLTPIAKKAHEKGIFIVNVDRGFLP